MDDEHAVRRGKHRGGEAAAGIGVEVGSTSTAVDVEREAVRRGSCAGHAEMAMQQRQAS